MEFKDLLQKRMTALKIKQVDLQKATGASKGTISMWVNGNAKPSQTYFLKLAKALRTTTHLLSLAIDEKITVDEFLSSPSSNTEKQTSAPAIPGVYGSFSPINQQTSLVHSLDQIIKNDLNHGVTELMYHGEIGEGDIFYQVETSQCEGRNGSGVYIPKGAIAKIATAMKPKTGDLALFNVNNSEVIGQYSVIGGKAYIQPSGNFEPIPVQDDQAIGVVCELIINTLTRAR